MGDAGSRSVAPDVAFAYRPEYSLTAENDHLVADLLERLARVRASGTDVVALVPSSLVHQKMTGEVATTWRCCGLSSVTCTPGTYTCS